MDNIEKQILDFIHDSYNNNGTTQDEIAKLLGVSQAHVCRLMSGKSEVGSLSIKAIKRIFPKATLNIDGSPSVSGVGVVVGEHISDVAINATGNAEKMTAIKNAILDSETLDSEAKVEVLKIIKSVEL